MKLEQQVVSLELAQKLKELGVKQESIFYYAHQGKIWSREHYYDNYNSNDENDQEAVTFEYYLQEVNGSDIYSAFTVAELGKMLPYVIGKKARIHTYEYFLEVNKLALGWYVQYVQGAKYQNAKEHIHTTCANTEADARAKMLIYLFEKDLIRN